MRLIRRDEASPDRFVLINFEQVHILLSGYSERSTTGCIHSLGSFTA
jgi:hypothetical protein